MGKIDQLTQMLLMDRDFTNKYRNLKGYTLLDAYDTAREALALNVSTPFPNPDVLQYIRDHASELNEVAGEDLGVALDAMDMHSPNRG